MSSHRCIPAPFRTDLGTPLHVAENTEICRHPIHRAYRWACEVRAVGSIRKVASIHGVTAPLLCMHLKLLTLAPEIQAFLRMLTTRQAIRHLSLRKMARLAYLPHEKHVAECADLRSHLAKRAH